MINPARQAKVVVHRWLHDACIGGWLADDGDDIGNAMRFLDGDRDAAALEGLCNVVQDYYSSAEDDGQHNTYESAQAIVAWATSLAAWAARLA